MSVKVKYPQKSVKKIPFVLFSFLLFELRVNVFRGKKSKEVKNIKVSSDLVKLLVLPSIFK